VPVFAIDTAATLLGIAALVSAFGGVISSMLAIRRAREDEYQKCLERLKQARTEAEELAQERHRRLMSDEN